MKKFFLTLMLFGVTGIAAAQEEPLRHYSADLIMITGKTKNTSKVYVENNKTRSETQQGPLQVVTITRPDEKIVYILLPKQKLFLEKPFLDADGLIASLSDKNTERALVDTETVKGQRYDKYKIIVRGQILYLWVNKSTQTPAYLVSSDQQMRMEWNNVQAGPQPAELFKPPPDYRKFSSGLGTQSQ